MIITSYQYYYYILFELNEFTLRHYSIIYTIKTTFNAYKTSIQGWFLFFIFRSFELTLNESYTDLYHRR